MMINNSLKMVSSLLLAWAVLSLTPGTLAAQGQELSAAEVVNGISARYGRLNTIQAAYSRIASTPSTDQLFKSGSSQVATGVLYWSRPDRLLLDQVTPQPEVMVTDGKIVWWHIPSEKLVYRYKNIDVASQLKPLVAFLGGLDSFSDFNVSRASFDQARPGQHGLLLMPKGEPDGGVDQLTIWCDDSFVLTGFRLKSVTGETTDFYLTGFQENPKIDTKMFNFKPPRGTEIIEEEGL